MGKRFQTTIEEFGLVDDCINLRKLGLSLDKVADELNNGGKLPENVEISPEMVGYFLRNISDYRKEIIKKSKAHLMQSINTSFNVYDEINDLYSRTKLLLLDMEEVAANKDRHVDAYRFKAVSSEMREMLRQMLEIQKEVNDYNNVRKFMEIVLETVQEEAIEALPVIIEKLKIVQGTQWFSSIMDKGREE